MRAHLEIIVSKFGRNGAICVVVEAIARMYSSWNELKITVVDNLT